MAKRGKNMTSKAIATAIVALFLAVVAFLQNNGILPVTLNPVTNGEVYLHVIDVGQGSSTLIQQGNEGVLIDAGELDYAEVVNDYINACGIETLKYVVASHPHSDHIGALPKVIEKYKPEEILMPEILEENLPTTRVYERFLDAIYDNEITASYCEAGDVYYMGDVEMEIIGPVEQVDDLNNMSAICKISVGDTDVMVLGDAEKQELNSVYKQGGDFESEILIMGHHGSRNSIHKQFLYEVNPEVALISCGKDNSYGHPHVETLEYLNENNIDYIITQYAGHIVYRIDAYGYERTNK